MGTSVHIVSEKQIVGVRYISSYSEQFKDIIELAVHITYQRDRTFKVANVVFTCKDLFYSCANQLNN